MEKPGAWATLRAPRVRIEASATRGVPRPAKGLRVLQRLVAFGIFLLLLLGFARLTQGDDWALPGWGPIEPLDELVPPGRPAPAGDAWSVGGAVAAEGRAAAAEGAGDDRGDKGGGKEKDGEGPGRGKDARKGDAPRGKGAEKGRAHGRG